MADKPSRGLVLFGDVLIPTIGPSHSHLHSIASKACCGVLSLPHSPLSDDRCNFTIDPRLQKARRKGSFESLRSFLMRRKFTLIRFMGLKAAIVTNNSKLRSVTEKLGCVVLQHEQLKKAHCDLDQEPPVEAVCNDLLNLLGIQGGKVLATSPFDLVFIHIGVGECVEGTEEEVKTSGIEYVNSLVGRIMLFAQPGSEIGSRLLLSLVMRYGDVSAIDCPRMVGILIFRNFASHVRAIPCEGRVLEKMSVWRESADRMLHEIAFKQWKAPKVWGMTSDNLLQVLLYETLFPLHKLRLGHSH